MGNTAIIQATLDFLRSEFDGAEGGHDFHHSYRVWVNAKKIAESLTCNQIIVELGALLHDIADSKFHDGNEDIGPQKAQEFLSKHGVESDIISQVVFIIRNISFAGGNKEAIESTIELDIVQDADRLEAIGAVGIARTFNYGGHIGTPIFDQSIHPKLNMDKTTYKKHKAPTINHFYEKLLLLKDKMNTDPGSRLAVQRHDYMILFLEQFYTEVGFSPSETPFDIEPHRI